MTEKATWADICFLHRITLGRESAFQLVNIPADTSHFVRAVQASIEEQHHAKAQLSLLTMWRGCFFDPAVQRFRATLG
jgi:hypothetical protein